MPQDSWYLAKEFRGDIEGGRFYNPCGAAFGPDGNFYVADRYNHRVQVFDAAGVFLRKWGGYGTDLGRFNEVTGIHVGPDGKVYVCDYNNHRVQVFNGTGTLVRSLGRLGSGDGQLNGPQGVTLDDDGNVYVLELNNRRVSVFRPDGVYLRQFGSSGAADGQFEDPIAMCRTPDNKIAVADRSGSRRVQVFMPDGTFVLKFTPTSSPHGIASDSSGNFYVAARDWGRIQVFSSTGAAVRVIGSTGSGSGNGQFNPYGLAVANGKVFVCDWDNHRTTVFTTAGVWDRNFGSYGKAEFDDTHGIARDASGNLFISDHQKHEVRKFDSNYNFVKRFGSSGMGDGQFNGPLQMTVGANQRLYVVDHNNHRVQYFDLEGNFLGKFGGNGAANGTFKFPWGIATGPDGRVYVADRDNHRVQVFDANGGFLFKFGTQGAFDGMFQQPHGLAISPEGLLAVADAGNERIQIFDLAGNPRAKFAWMRWESWAAAHPYRLRYGPDGLLYASGNNDYVGDRLRVYSADGTMIKEWDTAWAPLEHTAAGDLVAAHGDRVVRVWKRTFRTVLPEPANPVPAPVIMSQARRAGTSLIDVDYRVTDANDPAVNTAALAFRSGGISLSDVIPLRTFAEGTGSKLGAGIPTGQTHRFTWNVGEDWATDFGELQLEILAKDGRDLMNLDFIQIPASGSDPLLKISRTPVTDADFLSIWYWLVATGDPEVSFAAGAVSRVGNSVPVAGLSGEFFPTNNFTGTSAVLPGVAPYTSGSTSSNVVSGVQVLSIRWSGEFVPQKTGSYVFTVAGVDDVVNVWMGGTQVVTNNSPLTFTVAAQAGVAVPIRIDWDDRGGGLRSFILDVTPPGEVRRRVAESDFRSSGNLLAAGTSTTSAGRAYLLQRMGYREATAAEVLRAKEAGNPGVVLQWDPKLRVGPDERPWKVNQYGFETSATGYWLVPVSGN